MLYHHEVNEVTFSNLFEVADLSQAALMRIRNLRYDRPLGGAAGRETAADDRQEGEDDMDISGPGSVGGAGSIRPTELRPTQEVASTPAGIEMPTDEVEISSAAQMLEAMSTDPSVRAERLALIQAQIAAGTYDTPEKMDAAITRMLSDLS